MAEVVRRNCDDCIVIPPACADCPVTLVVERSSFFLFDVFQALQWTTTGSCISHSPCRSNPLVSQFRQEAVRSEKVVKVDFVMFRRFQDRYHIANNPDPERCLVVLLVPPTIYLHRIGVPIRRAHHPYFVPKSNWFTANEHFARVVAIIGHH